MAEQHHRSSSTFQDEYKDQIRALDALVGTLTEGWRNYDPLGPRDDASATDVLAITSALEWRCSQEAAERIAKEAPAGFVADMLAAIDALSEMHVVTTQWNGRLANDTLGKLE